MADLPFAGLAAITGPAPILVLAPHADDESLGCGGLIAQACAKGHNVHVVILTDGSRSHPNSPSYPGPRLSRLREVETAAAVAELGLKPECLHFFGYPDAAAPTAGAALDQAARRLAAFIATHGIGTVFATWQHDPHCDHEAAHRIAAGAASLTEARHLSYAVWGWLLPPDTLLPMAAIQGARLDIAVDLPTKRRAIACHRSQTTTMIDDDPAGFQVPAELLAACDRPFEVFIEAGADPARPGKQLR